MRRQRRDSGETSSHPFRSMFDLMVALVFLLLAFIVIFQPKASSINAQIGTDELLLLHNLHRRLADDSAPLLTDLNQLPTDDFCVRLALKQGAPLTDVERQDLEQHRMELWNKPGIKQEMNKRLLNKPIILTVPEKGKGRILFPDGKDQPTNLNDDQPTIDWIKRALNQSRNEKRPITRIRIEGHTDNVNIHTQDFPNNWVLSARRAIWLEQRLEQALASTPYRDVLIEPIGYADKIPAGMEGNTHTTLHAADAKAINLANSNSEKRQRNRRIRIVLEQN